MNPIVAIKFPEIAAVPSGLLVFLVFLSVAAHTQPIDYSTWKEESKTNIRLLPEYGNVPKTRDQQAADATFIAESLKEDTSRRKASDKRVDFGFKYLYRQDLKTAMYRFNQAWLLDHENENVYWGFGAIYVIFNDTDAALKQYDKGLKLNPKSSNILTDKGTVYVMKYQVSNSKVDMDAAFGLFKKSYAIEPKNQNTLFKFSVLYFMSGDCEQALKYFDKCMALGGKPVSNEYKEAIKKCRK